MANGSVSEAAGAGGLSFPEGGGTTPPPVVELPEVPVTRPAPEVVDSVSGLRAQDPDPRFLRPQSSFRPITPVANNEDIATLLVNGMIYEDWETVWLHWSLGEPWAQFRFTATEEVYESQETPPGILFDENRPHTTFRSLAQFAPPDEFEAFLGGQPVMSGKILVRQTAYDKNSHTIVLQGVSLTWYAARASVQANEKSEYHGTFKSIASEVLAPTCSTYKTWGDISSLEYETPQRPEPGETIFQFLERIGRNRNVMVVSDPYGDFVFIGPHNGHVVADLTEGENILKMQAIIKDIEPYSKYTIRASKQANDEKNMGDAAQLESVRQGTAACYSPQLTPIEHPASKPELDLRADHEYNFNERKVEADVTVRGWFNSLTGLRWDVGDEVYVKSPMAMLDMVLFVEAVTFTQDSRSGTLTVLKCVAPWNWNDNNWVIGANNHPLIQPPNAPAQNNNDPPKPDPTQVPHSQQ
jgi:prophage tail gpP-like protein